MNADHINPFVSVSCDILKQVCNIDANRGQIYIKKAPIQSERVTILVGLAGEIRGQVFFNMEEGVACSIASAMMMGMPVPKLDEMSKSAIAELGNMILGNTATVFSNNGINIDITTPTVIVGSNISITTKASQTICIPIEFNKGQKIEIDISIQD